jgi:ABC-type polysaccharide/polyol phosphate transport system ATPase subunit
MGQNSGDDVRKTIVEVKNLHFKYRIRNAYSKSLKKTAIDVIKRQNSDISINAITGIDFEISKGEILGVIGKNGAGKSTLLKLIAGILPPSSGSIRVEGRIAPLIQLGAGFNMELTGSENIELFGVLLGNSRREMKENTVKIAEWAGLTDSIHLPIRTYSSGMISRLGFAIATFQKCELLIVDEILSVGDSEFQSKSTQRIQSLMDEGEATILVSHNLDLVEQHATKALWVDGGRQVMIGNPKEVINAYRQH